MDSDKEPDSRPDEYPIAFFVRTVAGLYLYGAHEGKIAFLPGTSVGPGNSQCETGLSHAMPLVLSPFMAL